MLNNACLMGRFTANPELKYTTSGVPVVRFTLAVGRSYVRPGENRQTDFIDIVAWRKTAEFVSRYFKRGQLVAVEGSIQVRVYDAKDGTKRKAVEVVANNVHFAESKKSAEEALAYDENVNSVSKSSNSDLQNSEDMENKDSTDSQDEPTGFLDEDLLSESDLPF